MTPFLITAADLVKSYISACFNIFGWLSITSGVVVQPGQFIQAVRLFFDPDVDVPVWQGFLFFQAANIFLLLHNTLLQHRTPFFHDAGCKYRSHIYPSYSRANITA